MLERVFKQCLSRDSDLHMARKSIGLGKEEIIHEYVCVGEGEIRLRRVSERK